MLSIRAIRKKERGRLLIYLSIPFIYGMVIPLMIIDASLTMYQSVCFRLYGIPVVDRRRFVRFVDRGRATIYLLDRLNCFYCSYANGVGNYLKAVLAETEKYWCPIRAARAKGYEPPAHHRTFVSDGDEEALLARLKEPR